MIFITIIISLLTHRLFSERYLDDLHPNIPCEESLIKKSDVLAVIPLYNNKSIAEDKAWCQYVLSFNKTLIMHGVYHQPFNEFNTERNQTYVEMGINEFEKCFGYKPTEFKPLQLALSEKNKLFLKEEFSFKIYTMFEQISHKAYHCNDSGVFPNWVMNLI